MDEQRQVEHSEVCGVSRYLVSSISAAGIRFKFGESSLEPAVVSPSIDPAYKIASFDNILFPKFGESSFEPAVGRHSIDPSYKITSF